MTATESAPHAFDDRVDASCETLQLQCGTTLSLSVRQAREAGIAGVVDDAALVLSTFLANDRALVAGKRCIEVGMFVACPSTTARSTYNCLALCLRSLTPLASHVVCRCTCHCVPCA